MTSSPSLQEGNGAWSETVVAQTAAVPPEAPGAPTVLGSNRNTVSVRWDAPDADGGSPVLSYEVELRPKSKAALAGMADEWLTVYQVSSMEPPQPGQFSGGLVICTVVITLSMMRPTLLAILRTPVQTY